MHSPFFWEESSQEGRWRGEKTSESGVPPSSSVLQLCPLRDHIGDIRITQLSVTEP